MAIKAKKKKKAAKAATVAGSPPVNMAPYNAGYAANQANANSDTCPFSSGTASRATWLAGWYAADAIRHEARGVRKVRR